MDENFVYPRAINRLPVALRELWVSTFQDFYDPDAPSAAYKAAWGAVRAVSKEKERSKMTALEKMSDDDAGVMQKPYPHEHAARVRDPGDFQPDSFRSKEITAGVRMILGKLKGATAMTPQSYRFDAEQFSADEARVWLKKHDVTVQSFEASTGDILEDAEEGDDEDTEEKALTPPAFVELKVMAQPDGRTRWLLVSSGGFEDRDHEVVSTAFLASCVKSAQETQFRGPLLVQHIPGSNIGTCDMQVVVGEPGFLVESGTFDATPDGERAAAYYRECAQDYGASIKFAYVNRTGDGVYLPPGVIIERSLLPRARAAFPWSAIQLQEVSAMSATKEAREELARVLGDTRADEILAKLESSAQALKEAGVRWKEQTAQSQAAEPVVAAAVESEKTVASVAESDGAAPAETPETEAAPTEKAAIVAESADENQSMEVVLPDAVIDAVAQKAYERVTGRLDEVAQVFADVTAQLAELGTVVKRMGADLVQLQKAEDERIEEKVRQLPRATVKMIQRPTQTNSAIEVPADPAQGNDLLQRGLATLYGKR